MSILQDLILRSRLLSLAEPTLLSPSDWLLLLPIASIYFSIGFYRGCICCYCVHCAYCRIATTTTTTLESTEVYTSSAASQPICCCCLLHASSIVVAPESPPDPARLPARQMLPSTSSTPLFHTPPLPKESGNWSRPQSAASRSYPWVYCLDEEAAVWP